MGRLLQLVYGVVVYALFFVTFAYMFLFVGGVFVPKDVDDGAVGPAWLAVLVDAALIFIFGLQHAVMARPAFKRWWTRIIPPAIERSTFVLIATLLTALFCWQWRPIPTVIWDLHAPLARGLIYAQFCLGVFLAYFSSFLIDHFDLFGLRQVWLRFRGKPYTQRAFAERSVYRMVRHPLMLGLLIAFWSAPTMTVGHALFAGLFTAYILVGTRMEEHDLMAQHGAQYEDYRRRTPMLLPGLNRSPHAGPESALAE
jgi:methanethiol S-methyltransferase